MSLGPTFLFRYLLKLIPWRLDPCLHRTHTYQVCQWLPCSLTSSSKLFFSFDYQNTTVFWFYSNLIGHTFSTSFAFISHHHTLNFWEPPGSCLGLLHFYIYTHSPVGHFIESSDFKYYLSTDDPQSPIFILDLSSDPQTLMSNCLLSISTWMSSRNFKCNMSKTQILVISPKLKYPQNSPSE